MSKSIVAALFSLAVVSASLGQSGKPLLLRKPTVSRTEVAFSYAGDIWIASRDGGEARQQIHSMTALAQRDQLAVLHQSRAADFPACLNRQNDHASTQGHFRNGEYHVILSAAKDLSR